MSNQIEKKINNQYMWLYASVSAALLPWLGNFLTTLLYPIDEDHIVEIRQAAGIVLLLSIIALFLAIAALFKVGGMKRIIILATIVPTIFIGYMALFSYSWLGQ